MHFLEAISGRVWGGGTLKFRNHLALPQCFKWRSGGDMSCPVSSREPLGSRDYSSSLLASVPMFTLRASSYFLLPTKPAPLKPPSCGHVPRVSNAYDNTVKDLGVLGFLYVQKQKRSKHLQFDDVPKCKCKWLS